MNYGVVDNLPRSANPGDIAFVKSENQTYVCTDSQEWEAIESKDATLNTGVTEYELNGIIIAHVPDVDDDTALLVLKQYFNRHGKCAHMLLSAEGRDYTVFDVHRGSSFFRDIAENVVMEILHNRAKHIKLIEENEDGSIDCWIKRDEDDVAIMYKLFKYDWGLIECG